MAGPGLVANAAQRTRRRYPAGLPQCSQPDSESRDTAVPWHGTARGALAPPIMMMSDFKFEFESE